MRDVPPVGRRGRHIASDEPVAAGDPSLPGGGSAGAAAPPARVAARPPVGPVSGEVDTVLLGLEHQPGFRSGGQPKAVAVGAAIFVVVIAVVAAMSSLAPGSAKKQTALGDPVPPIVGPPPTQSVSPSPGAILARKSRASATPSPDSSPAASPTPTRSQFPPSPPPRTHSPGPPPHQVINSGSISGLRDMQGFDLESGSRTDAFAADADVHGSVLASQLVAGAGAHLALLNSTGPGTFGQCAAVPARSWTASIGGLYGLAEGTDVCVETHGGHLAVMTLTSIPTLFRPMLAFQFVVWGG